MEKIFKKIASKNIIEKKGVCALKNYLDISLYMYQFDR